MLRSLLNELWLYLDTVVGVKKNYDHDHKDPRS